MTAEPSPRAVKKKGADRSLAARVWYNLVRGATSLYCRLRGGLSTTGAENIPAEGAALIVSNHASYLDVFILGLTATRPLNYVARSTLFVFPLGILIRSVGGFPIQREGMGAQGLKETLRRLKYGGLVVLFPEGTRTEAGELGPLKPGIAALAAKAKAPVVPVGLAGTFDAWPRGRRFPRSHAIHAHYGPRISTEEAASLDSEALTALIRTRMEDALAIARRELAARREAGR